jgi:hypothetical protein
VFLGDQVYADESSPATRERVRERRERTDSVEDELPPDHVHGFEEYSWLYQESWGSDVERWFFSVVPSVMIFDDHDMIDDWNISESWVHEMREQPWWESRVEGGVMSYWIYQHLGNLSPGELNDLELLRRVREAPDAGPLLRAFAHEADRENEGTRWSFCRDADDVRVVVIDSRAGRVLGETRHGRHRDRAMVDDDEWQWLEQHVRGDVDHLVVGTSLPWLLLPGLHYAEAWSEAVCDGAWGRGFARLGERVRRAADLEHWPAFHASFLRLAQLLEDVAAGRRGSAPATITVVSGDVHHAYLAEVAFPRSARARSAVFQAVCSPFRNDLDRRERAVVNFGGSRVGHALTRALARAAGVADPPVRWRVRDGPWFDYQFATLRFEGREATLRLDKTVPGDTEARLETVAHHPLN